MAKINVEQLLKLKQEGKSLKELAEYFGCSKVAVWKRLKHAVPLPPSFTKLSQKEQKFVLAKARGLNNVQAATEAFDVTNAKSAKSIGSRLMKDPDVKEAVDDLMFQVGLGRRYLLQRLKTLVDHPDGNLNVKALNLCFQINKLTRPETENNTKPVIYISSEKLMILNQVEKMIREYEEQQKQLKEANQEQQNQITET
jgi:hypothetical protein